MKTKIPAIVIVAIILVGGIVWLRRSPESAGDRAALPPAPSLMASTRPGAQEAKDARDEASADAPAGAESRRVPRSSAEAERVLRVAIASLDFERGVSIQTKKRNTIIKNVDGVECRYSPLKNKAGDYILHNAEGDWVVTKDVAFRMDFMSASASDVIKHLAEVEPGRIGPTSSGSTFRTVDEGGDHYTIVEEINPAQIARFHDALDTPSLKRRMPAGVDLTASIPTARSYRISKGDGALLGWSAYGKNGEIPGSTVAIGASQAEGVTDDMFRLSPDLKRVPVNSMEEFQKLRQKSRTKKS